MPEPTLLDRIQAWHEESIRHGEDTTDGLAAAVAQLAEEAETLTNLALPVALTVRNHSMAVRIAVQCFRVGALLRRPIPRPEEDQP